MFHSSDNVEISFPFGALLKAVIQGEKYLSNITLKGRTGDLASYIHFFFFFSLFNVDYI